MSTQRVLVEVCVDSLASAQAAVLGGAHRLEICEDLSVGGVTPSIDLFTSIKGWVAARTPPRRPIPLFVLVRIRAGDFVYTPAEVAEMADQVAAFAALGADGVVIGALCPVVNDGDGDGDGRGSGKDGAGAGGSCNGVSEEEEEGTAAVPLRVDERAISAMLCRCPETMSVTFHRAIGELYVQHARDPLVQMRAALSRLASLGIGRVLTSIGPYPAGDAAAVDALRRLAAHARMLTVAPRAPAGAAAHHYHHHHHQQQQQQQHQLQPAPPLPPESQHLSVMPGGGVTAGNVVPLLRQLLPLGITEIHGSFRSRTHAHAHAVDANTSTDADASTDLMAGAGAGVGAATGINAGVCAGTCRIEVEMALTAVAAAEAEAAVEAARALGAASSEVVAAGDAGSST